MALPASSVRKRRGDFDLSGMAPERMDACVERRIRSARAVSRQSAGRQGGAKQRLGLEQADQRIGGRELRAVEQREPFLGPRHDGLEADFGERGGGRRDAIANTSLADTDHRRRHMRKRREIARRAHRSLRRDHRRDAARKHGLDESDRLRLDARGALREAADLQRHHEPRCRDRGRFADARGVRKDDVALKLSKVGRLDPHTRQLAEAGIDSVDRFATSENPLDRGGARGHAGHGSRGRRPAPRRARSPASRQATPRRDG